MSQKGLWENVPAMVMHLVAAGVNGSAAMGLGGSFGHGYTAVLAAAVLVGPVTGLALLVARRSRAGARVLLGSYVASAALGLYTLLGKGMLLTALDSPPGGLWKLLFFSTALLLPMLQAKGIFDCIRLLLPREQVTA